MTPADRSALVDRLARARAWNALTQDQRTDFIAKAQRDIAEIEVEKVQVDRIGWLLVDLDVPVGEVES